MRTQHNNRFCWVAGLCLGMLIAGTGAGVAQQVAEIPDYLTYVFPAYFPKNGQVDYSGSGSTPGDVRNLMANYYEGWWREVSYHRANPTNGLSERGFFMDTKTVGEVALPWANGVGSVVQGETPVSGLVVGNASADLATEYTGVLDPLPVGGRSIAFRIGTRVVSSRSGYDALGGDGSGFINLATGAYAFKLRLPATEGTAIEVFYTAYIRGAAPSPANWANLSQPMNDITAGTRMPDGRGEHFMESEFQGLSAVLYQRWDPAAEGWIDDPLVDGFWTPGERFTDQPRGGGTLPPTGGWNPYEHAEDRWTPSITNWGIASRNPGILPFGMTNFMVDFPQGRRGDFFFDYNFSILGVDADGRVLPPPAGFSSLLDLNVEIQVADRDRMVNVSTNISEFNLTPPRFFRSRVDVVSTNIIEDSWSRINRNWSVGIAGEILPINPAYDPLVQLLGDSNPGGVIADYTLRITANTNQVNASGHSRVTTAGDLAYTNASAYPFYVADFATGTNRMVALSSLDLTPPLFYTNIGSGASVSDPAEDRWEPEHHLTNNFAGIASILNHLAVIRSYFTETNPDGERYRGSFLLDYGHEYAPALNVWGQSLPGDPPNVAIGTKNVTIRVADIGLGTNRQITVAQMDLTPPLFYQNGIPRYGLFGTLLITNETTINLEGDVSHRYISETAVPAYARIPRLGRFEANFDVNDIPAMNDSGLAITQRVYIANAIYSLATNAPGVDIEYPAASGNVFKYDGVRVRILSIAPDFWNACVETGVVAYSASQYSEIRTPIYNADPLFGEPETPAPSTTYLNNHTVAGTRANPFRDAIGSDDVWTPGIVRFGGTTRVPYYGSDGANAITNDTIPTLEGDAGYTYNSPSTMAYTHIPGMGRFEYQMSSVDARPLVYLDHESYIEVKVLLPSTRVNQLRSSPGTPRDGAVYDAALGRIMVTNTPGSTANTFAFGNYIRLPSTLINVTSNATSLQYPAHVRVPVFYAEGLVNTNLQYRHLWGAPSSTNYLDAPVGPGVIDSRFVDATPSLHGGPDNQWTPFFTVSVTSPPIFSVSFDANGTIRTNNAPLIGDAGWTYVRDNEADPPNLSPTYGNIGSLNRIEFNIDMNTFAPHIYRSDFVALIETWVDLSQGLIDELEANEDTLIQGFSMIRNVLHVLEPSEQFFSSDIVAGNTTNANPDIVRRRALVHVPLYYSASIWGEPLDADNYRNSYSVVNDVENWFVDSVPRPSDEKWTEAVEADPMSDFIPIWDPYLLVNQGGWVAGLSGTPNSGTLPRGTEATPEYWSWTQYTDYIANNYPGDVAGLIARADNNLYDGPERWAEVGNNQMIQNADLLLPTVRFGSWDFSVGPAHIRSYEDWWLDRYGRFGSTSSEFAASVPVISEWKPQLTDFNQGQSTSTNFTTNAAGVVTSEIIYGSLTHPPNGTTWTYDAPREFDDLASSMHVNPDLGALSGLLARGWSGDHNPDSFRDGGDLRLGEATSPWSDSIWGEDRGFDDPNRRNTDTDDLLRMAGPYACNVYANFGYDAANLLNLEYVTHRTDGHNLTGPRGGHAKPLGYNYMVEALSPMTSWGQGIIYARDHRDVNLTGMIDQGETIPANSQNYAVDPQADSQDNGMNTFPVFGWERLMEHLVSIYDAVEDFGEVGRYTVPGRTGTTDDEIMQPSGFRWFDGVAATARLADRLGAPVLYADLDGSGGYTLGADALWVDSTADGLFSGVETLIHNPSQGLGLQEETDGFGPVTAQWADLDSSGAFESFADLAWMDDMSGGAAGVFDSEPVLADQGLLQPGMASVNHRTYDPVLGINRSIYVYPDVANFSLMWTVTNTYNGMDSGYPVSANGVELIYREPGFVPAPGVTIGVLWTGADVLYVSANPQSASYAVGDSIFIDTDGNGTYDGDSVVSTLARGLQPSYDGLPPSGSFSIGYTPTNGIFDRATSAVWLETLAPGNRRNRERLISSAVPLPDGTPATADVSANIQWIDLPIGPSGANGTFDPVVLAEESELGFGILGDAYIGDALFYDRNTNGLFNGGAKTRRGVYMASLFNPAGVPLPPVYFSGQKYLVRTQEGMIGGFMQSEPISVVPGVLTHEQSHDVLQYPDLYDYDASDPEFDNNPVSTGDLMSGGGLIHGYPDLKFRSNLAGGAWPALNAVTPVELNTGANAILSPDGTKVTLKMFPVERHPDQYYVFRKEGSPYEYYTLAYNAGAAASPYANAVGRGLMITKSDYAISPAGRPQQQRSNNRYTFLIVQADAAYNAEDGAATIGPEDAFGNTPQTRVFTAHTRPPAIWWDKSGSGLRVLDIRIPADPLAPAEVDLQWVPVGAAINSDFPVHYDVPPGADTDGDGIPDAWEYYWFGRYPNPLAVAGSDQDYDLDGLSDYYEWLAGSDPTGPNSWPRASNLNDANLDIDGDGLSNVEEQRQGTHPRLPDTDDNGLLDGSGLDPLPSSSLVPLVDRVLSLNGAATSYVVTPDHPRFALLGFTIQAWINPSAAAGDIIARQVQANAYNYRIRLLADRRVELSFTPSTLAADVKLESPVGLNLPLHGWTHVAGTFDPDTGYMRIFINGVQAAALQTGSRPTVNAAGPQWTRLGSGFAGMMDEVVIAATAYAPSTIDAMREGVALVGVTTNTSHVAYYRFDDGTSATGPDAARRWNGTSLNTNWSWGQVEDFAASVVPAVEVTTIVGADGVTNTVTNTTTQVERTFDKDWMNNWRNAGTLIGNVSMANAPADAPVLFAQTDSNGDGIPDWWCFLHGFDPFGPSIANADDDSDGISNYWEFRVGTDPKNPYSMDPTGLLSDYDWRVTPTDLTYGELYTAGDGIPILWKVQYSANAPTTGNPGLSLDRYDADLDPDEDGWSNLAEYLGSYGSDSNRVRSPSPLDPLQYPTPQFTVQLRYSGELGSSIANVIGAARPVLVSFHRTPERDGLAVGRLAMQTGMVTTRALSSGHLVEGSNYLFAFLDANNNGVWDTDWTNNYSEAAGIAVLDAGWADGMDVEIELTHEAKGYWRFAWAPVPGALGYKVEMRLAGSTVYTRTITGNDRTFFHEGDYQVGGLFGLQPALYSALIYSINDFYGVEPALYRAVTFRKNTNTVSTTVQPVIMTPQGIVMTEARGSVEWRMDPYATRYEIQIANGSTGGAVGSTLLTTTRMRPNHGVNGNYRDRMPFYAGDTGNVRQVWTNGVYWMRLRGLSDNGNTPYSEWRSFTVKVETPENAGKSAIEGELYYFGRVQRGITNSVRYLAGETNLHIIVQAYRNAACAGEPAVQVQVNARRTDVRTGALFELRGLEDGAYYLRAFMDLNGNRKLDLFEPRDTLRNGYDPKPVETRSSPGIRIRGQRLILRDHDMDDDNMADGWEYSWMQTLDYGPNNAPAGDGVTLLATYLASGMLPGLSPLSVHSYTPDVSDRELIRLASKTPDQDRDGDGMSDLQEIIYAKTSPDDVNDVLKLLTQESVMPISGGIPGTGYVRIVWQGKPGVRYVVLSSQDLVRWTVRQEFVGSGTHSFGEPEVTRTRQFYRVEIR